MVVINALLRQSLEVFFAQTNSMMLSQYAKRVSKALIS